MLPPITFKGAIAQPGEKKPGHQPKFGWHQSVDIGTSQGINAKVTTFDDQWSPLKATSNPAKITSMTPGTTEKNSSLSARNAVITHMLGELKQVIPLSLAHRSSVAKNPNLIFFVPGQVKDNVVSYIGQPGKDELFDLNLTQVPSRIKAGLVEMDTPTLTKADFKMTVINDMAGGLASALAQTAKNHPDKFQPGMDATFLMSGGGTGIAGATYEHDAKNVPLLRLHLMESGCLPKFQPHSKNPVSPKMNWVLKGFSDHFPSRYDEELKTSICNLQDMRPFLNHQQMRPLLPDISQQEFHYAASRGVKNYLDMLGLNLGIRIATGSNLAILGGQILQGVKGYVNQNPKHFDDDLAQYGRIFQVADKRHTDFDKVFLARTWTLLPDKLKKLFKERQFDVISDLDIKNNTEGAPYIAKGWFANRSDRFVIPASVFLKK